MDASRPAAAVAETHGSTVFFTADRALKVLKPVRTPFFDYSTPALRREACEREVELNRRLAPDVYLGTSPIFEHGVEADCMVVMRRLPSDRRLSALVGTPEFDALVAEVAHVVGTFHAGLPPDGAGAALSTRDAVADLWTRQNLDDLDEHAAPLLGADHLAEIRRRATRFLAGREPLFAARITAGHVVDGHGDLLADDIFCLPDGPRILDCLAFSDDLRRGDTAADLAFLAMDLERLAGPAAARVLVDAYVEATGDHVPGPLLHHWIAYRALVRAKVRVMRAAQGDDRDCRVAADEARDFRDQCLRHLRAATVTLTLVGGAPGTGKTTLAGRLGDGSDAVVLSSDEVRKDLAGVGRADHAGAPLDAGLYDATSTDATYAELLRRAGDLLVMGWSVVLDASWSSAERRAAAAQVAARTSSELEQFRCVLDPEAAARRIAARLARGDDASDATPDLSRELAARFEPWPQATEFRTG